MRILVQPYFQSYQSSGVWHLDGIGGRVIFSLIAGIVALPMVYRKTLEADTPGILQYCAIFVAGMGWQSLLPAALKLAQSAFKAG